MKLEDKRCSALARDLALRIHSVYDSDRKDIIIAYLVGGSDDLRPYAHGALEEIMGCKINAPPAAHQAAYAAAAAYAASDRTNLADMVSATIKNFARSEVWRRVSCRGESGDAARTHVREEIDQACSIKEVKNPQVF